MAVMPYSVTMLHQAERTATAAERRRADIEAGLMAAGVSRLWRRVTRPVRVLGGCLARRGETIGW